MTREIYRAIVGDKTFGQLGLVGQVDDHEDRIADNSERISKLETRFKVWAATIAGIGLAFEGIKTYFETRSGK